MRPLLAVLAAATLVVPSAAAEQSASAARVDLLKTVRKELPRLKRATRVPILLPTTLLVAGPARPVYAFGSATATSWGISLAATRRCGGADACFVASFDAEAAKRLPDRANIRLAGGIPAYYHPISCGASCTPASLWFVHGGVLFSWQVNDPQRPVRTSLIRMANEALQAGPR